MVDWWRLVMPDAHANAPISVQDTLYENLMVVPASLREKLALVCDWRLEQMPKLANCLPYKTLMGTIRAMCERYSLDSMGFLKQWFLLMCHLNDSNMCALHLMCAQGDADMLAYALEHGG